MLYILDTDHAIHSVTSQNNRMNLYLCHESKSTGKNFGLQISQLIPANASLRSTFPSLLQETIELTFNQFSVGSTNAPYEIVVVKIKLHAGNQKVHVNCFWHLLLDVIHSSVISLGRPKKIKKVNSPTLSHYQSIKPQFHCCFLLKPPKHRNPSVNVLNISVSLAHPPTTLI